MAGVFSKIFKRKSEGNVDDILTILGSEEMFAEQADMWVKSMVLDDVTNVEQIAQELRQGNEVILNIEPLSKKNAIKLRQAIAELKSVIQEINGDIARISEQKILLTPSGVKIARK
ncbi:MAG: cell division protein SepF [archaeon]